MGARLMAFEHKQPTEASYGCAPGKSVDETGGSDRGTLELKLRIDLDDKLTGNPNPKA